MTASYHEIFDSADFIDVNPPPFQWEEVAVCANEKSPRHGWSEYGVRCVPYAGKLWPLCVESFRAFGRQYVGDEHYEGLCAAIPSLPTWYFAP